MSDLPRLIGIAGKKGSGKDTLGAHLVKEYGYVRYAFADKLKEAVVALDPLIVGPATKYQIKSLKTLWREGESAVELLDRLKNDHPEARRLMQAMGNEVGQGIFGEYFWIDLVLTRIKFASTAFACITDVRFPHEAESIRRAGGTIIRIQRSSTDDHGDNHASEVMVDKVKYDCHVLNDGTTDEFLIDAVGELRDLGR